jgi:hypothetical protein
VVTAITAIVYGFRTAELVGEIGAAIVPHHVMHYRAGDQIRWHERLVESKPQNPDIQDHFMDTTGTGLPYLEMTSSWRER